MATTDRNDSRKTAKPAPDPGDDPQPSAAIAEPLAVPLSTASTQVVGVAAAAQYNVAQSGQISLQGTRANQFTRDTAGIALFGGVSISDPNAAATVTLSVTLSNAANGSLAILGSGDYTAATGVYTVTGAVTQVSASLAGLVFIPSGHQSAPGQTISTTATIRVSDSAGAAGADTQTSVNVAETPVPVQTTIARLNGSDGVRPAGTLIVGANGDLFGTAQAGATSGVGDVFEVTYTVGAFGGTPLLLSNMTGTRGANPTSGVIFDATGNLFGTAQTGGPAGDGTVFEVVKSAGGYASAPVLIAAFNGTNGNGPAAGLVMDAAGDLFGTTALGGASNLGTIFEIPRLGSGYAAVPLVLASLDATTGYNPQARLAIDPAGNLYGAAASGGIGGAGTVFELQMTTGGYAAAPVVLTTFNGSNGSGPSALIRDGAGNLFGTTSAGGSFGKGTVFEVAFSGGAYSAGPIPIISFNGAYGADPLGGLIMDAAGDLFGTTFGGGTNNAGTVFEVAQTGAGYPGILQVLANFDGTSGANPFGGLAADGAGDLFGTTFFGSVNGSIFEITNSGYQTAPRMNGNFMGNDTSGVLWQNTNGALAIWSMQGGVATAAFGLGTPGAGWRVVGTGDFQGNGGTDILFQYGGGLFAQWQVSHGVAVASTIVGVAGTGWNYAGTGFFSGAGAEGLLFRDSNGDIAQWQVENGVAVSSSLIGVTSGDWTVAAIGRLSLVGSDSILFINAGGTVADWTVAAGHATDAAVLGQTSAYWSIVGLGDFTGNGQNDILFRGQNSELTLWLTQNGRVVGADFVGITSPDWRVAAIGDYNGDGTDDILFANASTGAVSAWTMTNGMVSGVSTAGTAGPGWQVAPLAVGVTLPS